VAVSAWEGSAWQRAQEEAADERRRCEESPQMRGVFPRGGMHGIEACEGCGAVLRRCRCRGPHEVRKSGFCTRCHPPVVHAAPPPQTRACSVCHREFVNDRGTVHCGRPECIEAHHTAQPTDRALAALNGFAVFGGR
jgi:hypothetical protein